jgi:hypothetical protein
VVPRDITAYSEKRADDRDGHADCNGPAPGTA